MEEIFPYTGRLRLRGLKGLVMGLLLSEANSSCTYLLPGKPDILVFIKRLKQSIGLTNVVSVTRRKILQQFLAINLPSFQIAASYVYIMFTNIKL